MVTMMTTAIAATTNIAVATAATAGRDGVEQVLEARGDELFAGEVAHYCFVVELLCPVLVKE
jgi:hypothetical protein